MAEKDDWKSSIKLLIKKRNEHETLGYSAIIQAHSKLLSSTENLRSQNVHLTLEVERLRQELQSQDYGGGSGESAIIGKDKNLTVAALEQKIYKLQEDLTDSLRNKGENAQKIIDLNNALQEKREEMTKMGFRIMELEMSEKQATSKVKTLEEAIEEQKRTIDILHDEQQVLQMEWTTLDEKCRKLQVCTFRWRRRLTSLIIILNFIVFNLYIHRDADQVGFRRADLTRSDLI